MVHALLAVGVLIAAPGWQTINEEDGVKVETRDAGGGHTIVRGTTELDVPAAEVVRVLTALEQFKTWIPSLHTWDVLEKKEGSAFVYARHELPWPMDDRDYRVRYVWKTGAKGEFTLEARSTKSAGPGPIEGVIRLADVRSKWIVKPLGSDRVRVAYMYHGALGGRLPSAVIESTWKREPVVLFAALAKRIAETKKK